MHHSYSRKRSTGSELSLTFTPWMNQMYRFYRLWIASRKISLAIKNEPAAGRNRNEWLNVFGGSSSDWTSVCTNSDCPLSPSTVRAPSPKYCRHTTAGCRGRWWRARSFETTTIEISEVSRRVLSLVRLRKSCTNSLAAWKNEFVSCFSASQLRTNIV